ncbi:MAG: protein kinase [bacterium]
MHEGSEVLLSLAPGQKVGRYEILAEIGSGGMGVVYRARDSQLHRDVALKFLWPRLAADTEYRRRFLREARAASRLSYPAIVPVFEASEHEGVPWIAMQLVDGKDLRAVIAAEGKLPPKAVLRYAEEVASALDYAHAHNVLHRDVTPKNILITSDGRVMLSDFGLARYLTTPPIDPTGSTESSGASDPTSRGSVLGTPRYMSPEQALGRELDGRSDLYSLGVVMYEMCTGTPPFAEVSGGALLDAIIHREPEPIARTTYEVPPELERIIRKAMAKEREERYPDMRDLLVDIRTLRREVDGGSTSGRALRPAPRRSRARDLALVGAGFAGGALLLLLVLWSRMRTEEPMPIGTPVQVTSSPARERDPALSPDGGRIAYASDARGNFDLYVIDVHGGTPLRLTDQPSDEYAPCWFPDGTALAYVSKRDGAEAIWKVGQMGGATTLLLADAVDPAVSPDDARLAFAAPDSQGNQRIGVVPLGDLEHPRFVSKGGGAQKHICRYPSWSPDGTRICYSDWNDLWLVSPSGGDEHALTRRGLGDREPAWSSSGRFLYFSSYRDGSLALWRVAAGGGEPRRVSLGGGSESRPSVCRSGRRLAYATHASSGDANDVILLDLATRREQIIGGASDDNMPAIAPDGSLVAFSSNRWSSRYELWTQRVENGGLVGEPVRLTDQPGHVSHPSFSSDGRWIAYYRVAGEDRDIWTIPAAGGRPNRFTQEPHDAIYPVWSPDGTRICFLSQREEGLQVWIEPVREGRPAGPARRVTAGAVLSCPPTWSPDGSAVAFVRSAPGSYEIWVAAAGGTVSERRIGPVPGGTRLRWSAAARGIFVCGSWGSDRNSCRLVDADSAKPRSDFAPVEFGAADAFPGFDLTADGRLMVYARNRPGGDVWVLEATHGAY